MIDEYNILLMKDKIKIKCDSCLKYDHSMKNCPLIMFYPNRLTIIEKFINNQNNKRNLIFRNKKKKKNAWILKKKIDNYAFYKSI